MDDNISIYTNKDGRTRVYLKDKKKVISYPRYIMEREIGRPLKPDEDVHHIDENPLNNDISNLEICHHGEHQRDHSTKYFDKIMICPWCKNEFVWTGKQQSEHYRHSNDRSIEQPFCSKKCVGSYGAMLQHSNFKPE